MLVWGDYVLVPFFYSIVGWTLLHVREPVPNLVLAWLAIVYVVGFWLFRGSNEQKHRFKMDSTCEIWSASRPKSAASSEGRTWGFVIR